MLAAGNAGQSVPERVSFAQLDSPWSSTWFRWLAVFTVLAIAGTQLWRLHRERVRRREERSLREAHLLSEGTIDALSANICTLDEGGFIIAVNKAWLRFAGANGQHGIQSWRGVNYLAVCDRVQGVDAGVAAAFAEGIRAVARRERDEFELEYECHSPQERRWCVGRVTRFEAMGVLRIVIAHEDITKQKSAALALQEGRRELELRVQERTSELQSAHDLLAQSRERLVSVSLGLVAIQEAERRAIARELHDEIGQILTSLRILLDMTERQPADVIPTTLSEAKNLAGELIERIRQLSLNLRPPMLDDLGLLSTLEWHFKRYTKLTGIRVHFTPRGLPARFATAIETAAYRLIQEALTNVARYAKVQEVAVEVALEKESLKLGISDRGVGFDAEAVLRAGNSNGLSIMRERVALLHGDFQVTAQLRAGTRIQIRLPLN